MTRIFLFLGLLLMWMHPVGAQVPSVCDNFEPSDAGALYYVGLGNVFSASGRFADAQLAYDCSIQKDANIAQTYVLRAVAHTAQQNLPAALDDYNRALALDETLLTAYNNRGMLHAQNLNFTLALADFDLLIILDPTYTAAYHNRAMIHAAEGNYTLALADLEQALALDETFAAAHQGLGAVYLALAAESYRNAEQYNGRPMQFDAPDTLQGVIRAVQESDYGVWLNLQTLTGTFEGAES